MDKKTQYKSFFKQIIKESLLELLRDKEIMAAIKGVISDSEDSYEEFSTARSKNTLSQQLREDKKQKTSDVLKTLSKATGFTEDFFKDVKVGGKNYVDLLQEQQFEKQQNNVTNEEERLMELVPKTMDSTDAGIDLSQLSVLFGKKR